MLPDKPFIDSPDWSRPIRPGLGDGVDNPEVSLPGGEVVEERLEGNIRRGVGVEQRDVWIRVASGQVNQD
jgi:hypothetical protein